MFAGLFAGDVAGISRDELPTMHNTPQACENANPILEKYVRKFAIPKEVMEEIEASDLAGYAKLLVYWIIYRSLTTRARSCAIHQGLLDACVGHRVRKALVKFIKASSFIFPASKGLYRAGRQCRRYELTGVDITYYDVDHHNSDLPPLGGDLALVGGGGVAWRTVDFSDLMERIFRGFQIKNWNDSLEKAMWSISQLDEPVLTQEDIIEHVGDDSQAESQIQSHERYCDASAGRVMRKEGRTYTPVTSLAKWIREREIRFQQQYESLDISCCYPWVLAAEHRLSCERRGLDTTDVNALMDLMETGKFYEKIAELAGVSTEDAKADFQQFCIFGPIGWHGLWKALRTLCPGLCRDIQWWRSQAGGSTRLAYFLQRAEGQLMTDGLIDWLVSGGLPAVQIHDGCIVPEGAAHFAAEWLKNRSAEVYGRSCRVSVVVGGVKSYV